MSKSDSDNFLARSKGAIFYSDTASEYEHDKVAVSERGRNPAIADKYGSRQADGSIKVALLERFFPGREVNQRGREQRCTPFSA